MTSLPNRPVTEPAAARQPHQRTARTRRLLIAAGLALGLAGGGATAAYVLSSQGPDNEREAERACTEEYVPAKLKAPATAQFSNINVSQEGDSGYFTVTGSVDAENAFGALVRSPFKCYVHVEGGTARMISVDAG